MIARKLNKLALISRIPGKGMRVIISKNLSSLYNPMFPERPRAPISIDSNVKKTKKSDEPTPILDFFTNHGGKVTLGVLGFFVFLFYSFYKNGKARNQVEDEIGYKYPIEPYEIQELRELNDISLEEFQKIVKLLRDEFLGRSEISYSEFVNALHKHNLRFKSFHLLDRLFYSYFSSPSLQNDTDSNLLKQEGDMYRKSLYQNTESPQRRRLTDKSSELNFYLVALSLTMSPIQLNDRIKAIFEIFTSKTTNFQSYDHDNSIEDNDIINRDTFVHILELMVNSGQIPPEKQSADRGFSISPFKSYRQKLPEEILKSYEDRVNDKKQVTEIDYETFEKLMKCMQICAWGSCYSS